MRPSEYRSGAPGETIRFAVVRSYLGPVLVAATERGICAIEFGRSADALKDRLRARFPKAKLRGPDPGLREAVAGVLSLLDEPRKRRPALPLDVEGTSFQRRVWQAPLLAMFSVTFAGTLFLQLFTYLYLSFSGTPLPLSDVLGLVTLPSLLLNMLFAIPGYVLMRDLARWVYPSEETA